MHAKSRRRRPCNGRISDYYRRSTLCTAHTLRRFVGGTVALSGPRHRNYTQLRRSVQIVRCQQVFNALTPLIFITTISFSDRRIQ